MPRASFYLNLNLVLRSAFLTFFLIFSGFFFPFGYYKTILSMSAVAETSIFCEGSSQPHSYFCDNQQNGNNTSGGTKIRVKCGVKYV